MGDYWVKLYTEILDDPKMGTLSDRLWRRVIEMFLLAGKLCADKSGLLPETKQLAWILRMPTDELEKDLNELAETGIIKKSGNGWLVVNFKKRQEKIDVSERVKRYRERQQRNQYYNNDNVTQMKRNVTDDGNDNVTQMKRNVTQINRLTDNRLTETESETETELITAAANNGGFSKNDDSEEYFSERMKPLLSAFSEATGIRPPVGGGFITKRWHEAMLELLNQQATPEEIIATIKDMADKGLRISGPWSIINSLAVYRSKEHAKKRFVQYYDSEGRLVEVEV